MSSNNSQSQPTARQSPRSGGVMDKNDGGEKRKANLSTLGADNSLNLSSGVLPSKRPRVEFTPSRSPVMSPIFEDESPTKLFPPPKDKIEATMDLAHVPLLEEDDENADLNTKPVGHNAEKYEDEDNTHFVLPSPLNTMAHDTTKGKDEDNGAESDSDSDKFFAKIKAREEEAKLHEKRESGENEHTSKATAVDVDLLSPSTSCTTGLSGGLPGLGKKLESPFYAITPDGKISIADSKSANNSSTSQSSPLDSEYMMPPNMAPLDLEVKVYCPHTGKLLYDTVGMSGSRIRSDFTTVSSFLRRVGVNLDSANSGSMSGYSADMSSMDSHCSMEFQRRKQVSMMSTISSIPRPSDASTISRPSYASAKDAFTQSKPTEPRQGIHGGKMAPLLNSTRIEDQDTQSMVNVNDRTTKSNPFQENVLDINSNTNSGHKGAEILSNGDSLSPNNSNKSLFATPNTSKTTTKPGRKGATKTPQAKVDSNVSFESDSGDILTSRAQTPKGRWKANNSTNISSSDGQTSSSSVGSSSGKRRGRGDQSDTDSKEGKDLTVAASKAIAEFNDDSFVRSANLWGSISRGSIVFARWRDKSYYSGIISDKGANDTWKIHFDDNMDDVASETHILPIKLLGYGVRGVYCPPDTYKPAEVVLVGLKQNPDANSKTTGINSEDIHAHIEYAGITMDGELIHCTRKNLTLKENVAKDLRREFSLPTNPKIGQIGVENIVEETRRRRGGESLAPSDKIRRIIKLEQSGFDTSTSDELMREVSLVATPTGPTPKKTASRNISKSGGGTKSKSGTPRRRPSNTSGSGGDSGTADSDAPTTKSLSVATPTTSKTSGASTSTPKASSSGATLKETPKTANKAAALVSASKPKKVKEKKIFEGIQFFMTASGGAAGDPSGCGPVVIPYDKDECRDLIEKGGGRIIDVVGHELRGEKHPMYLISDSFARTVKFIYCVASGIPCLSYKWVVECDKQNTFVDWKPYQLDSGWSLEENKIIPAHKNTPLKGLKVYITAESADLYNYWKPVLTAAQASLLKHSPKGPLIPPQAEVLVTDSTCPQSVVTYALKKDLPVVKPEWLVQTIIRGKRSAYDGSDKYKLDQSEDAEADQE